MPAPARIQKSGSEFGFPSARIGVNLRTFAMVLISYDTGKASVRHSRLGACASSGMTVVSSKPVCNSPEKALDSKFPPLLGLVHNLIGSDQVR
jgi:hypothetical protein